MRSIVVIIMLTSFVMMSCATIFSGSNTGLKTQSTPDNAEVWVDGGKAGVTPCKVELKKNQEHNIEFKKENYQSRSYRLSNSVGAGWIILDVVCGLIPVIVDAATGSWYSLSEDNLNVVLEKK